MQGKLIVFEGTDGSGKATQSQMLCAWLEGRGHALRRITFPRYGQPSAAMVQEYLDGRLGKSPGDVNAYAASLFYAMDRYASYKQDWGDFYWDGGLVVADRYTTSNAVHQSTKLPPGEREVYLNWLFDLEYRLLELPRPDLVLYLDMPDEISSELLRRRRESSGMAADIHEGDGAYLRACREVGRETARQYGWRTINCGLDGAPRSIEDIHGEICRIVEELLP